MKSFKKIRNSIGIAIAATLATVGNVSAHLNITSQAEFEQYQADIQKIESLTPDSRAVQSFQNSEPLQATAGNHISPIVSKTYSSKIYVSKQISNFVTPDKVHDYVNEQLAKAGVNKRLQGVGSYFDQTVKTNCSEQGWSQKDNKLVTFYLPDEICDNDNTGGFPIVGAIIADVPKGMGNGNRWYAHYSHGHQADLRARTILHELGHIFGFTVHYDDAFYMIQDTPPFLYKSPYFYDLMGLEATTTFGFHSANVINRSTGIQWWSESALVNDYLSSFPLKKNSGVSFSGQIWVYPNQITSEHLAGTINEKFYYGPISLNGLLDYTSINKPMLAYIKAKDTQGNTSEGWIDRSVMQTHLWQSKEYAISLKPTGFLTPMPRPSATTKGEIVLAANLPGDGDKRNVYLLELSTGRLQAVTKLLDHDAENPTISRDGNTIAYINHSAKPTIRIINRQGILQREIDLSNKGYTSSVILDTNGTKVLFNGSESRVNKLFIATKTGSSVQSITAPQPTGLVTLHGFGQNGTRFTFSNNGYVYLAHADGTSIQHLSQMKEFITQGALSPNGNEFVYQKYNTATNSLDLYVLDLTTNQSRILAALSNTGEFHPSFSPDGKKIFFSSESNGTVVKIHSINLDGSGLQTQTLSAEKLQLGFSAWGLIPQVGTLVGDVNADGVISMADYTTLKANFGNYSIKILNHIIAALIK